MGAMKNTPLALTIGEIGLLSGMYKDALEQAKKMNDFHEIDKCEVVIYALDEVNRIIERNFNNS